MIDDSALIHARRYDPQKAREYYLRTRKLKGRKPGASELSASPASSKTMALPGGRPNRSKTKSRQAELETQKVALEKRLERLRDVLSDLVEAAKKRNSENSNKKDGDRKDTAPETQVDKADRNKDQKDRTPLTASQKADKAQKAKEDYEKEHPTSLSTDVDILREQVKDIQNKIASAVQDARDRRTKAGQKDAKSGSKNMKTDGPKGR